MMSETTRIVVTDFDGTLTAKDIGNELCLEVIPELFKSLYARYRKNEIDLKEFQLELWTHFPLSESEFRSRALAYGDLRPGVNEFFEHCADRGVPVFVASCGLRPYIEEVLRAKLSRKALKALREIRCNEAHFDSSRLSELIPPATSPECPYPLDKGAWCSELKTKFPATTRVFGIGNGTSDRSFKGHIDEFAATEALADWCESSQTSFTRFEDFRDLMPLLERFLS